MQYSCQYDSLPVEGQHAGGTIFSSLCHFCRSIAAMGPQSKTGDVALAVVKNAGEVMNTNKIAVYLIDPIVGSMYSKRSDDTSEAMVEAFQKAHGKMITNVNHQDALIYRIASDCDGPQEELREAGIAQIAAASIRSKVGLNGAVVGFYDTELANSELTRHAAQLIADMAAVAMSYAYTIEQSHSLLDDFAGSAVEFYTQASEDALTGLNNHRFLQQTLSHLCRNASKKAPFSFIMADVDFFKRYNDTYGHLEGDRVLRQIAMVLTSQVRQTDLVSRYGGEEFGIVLRGSDSRQAKEIAERIREVVESTECGEASVTLSLGVASFPTDATSPSDLITCADRALYEAKRSGRNRVCVWSESRD